MKELEKYREIYNQFITLFTQLHNVNVKYSKMPARETGIELRGILRKFRTLEKNLWKASVAASEEAMSMKRAAQLEKTAQKLAEAEYKKLNPPKKGRPPKEKTNG